VLPGFLPAVIDGYTVALGLTAAALVASAAVLRRTPLREHAAFTGG
jgi:hypothetical protein